ncbi:hypothetical protein DSC45_06180 [Streptomyces sp. YIM 130001]|uniref:helix-turn-helix domain-containing protein n=1 Tax=Streptomyces sp. YIM 130001 TaxID=2259644 RepID=UPI000E6463DB|nr:helix-turn-helix transcriptional regulator [Streptomyces sp. YIM 130001]RII19582.1 hypothetical protein DSC45_06180 [Streptomyces sp. YIM 130001]
MPAPKDLDPSASPRAMLGAELRHARERAGLSQDALGEPLFVSGSFIGQLEAGTRRIQPDVAVRLDEILGTRGFFARNGKVSVRSQHPDHFAEAADAEARATEIRDYSGLLIPGLVQTEAYARAVFRAYRPTGPAAVIDGLVAARLDRAHLLTDPTTPLLDVVLDEAALRRKVGGAGAMMDALGHLVALIEAHRITAQVIPFGEGAHSAMGGSLKLMYFADDPAFVYFEGPGQGRLEDDPATVAAFERTYARLWSVASSPRHSLALIQSIAEDYRHEHQHP